MDVLKEADTKLRARRILDVKSLDPLFGPDYYLVELDDLNGARYARLGRGINSRYVYAMSIAEPGSPVYNPLVAVDTPKGTVYINSKGQAFAPAGSALHKEASTIEEKSVPYTSNKHLMQLCLLDRWQ